MKPFSTYPEDRQRLLDLSETIETAPTDDAAMQAAFDLADLVRAILTDEAVAIKTEDAT